MFQRLIAWFLQHRLVLTLLLGLATLVGLGQTLRLLRVDNSLAIWFLDNNPDYQEYLRFQAEQGSDEIIVAMLPSQDALETIHLDSLLAFHTAIDSLPYVNASLSLANFSYPLYLGRNIRYRSLYRPNRSRESLEQILKDLKGISPNW